MTGADWIKPLAVAALLTSVGAGMFAQSRQPTPVPSGSAILPSVELAGTLTDLYGHPLEDTALTLRNEGSGVEEHTITGKKGSYRFIGLASGAYTLEATQKSLGRGRLEGIPISGEAVERILTAMDFERPPNETAPKSAVLSLPVERTPVVPSIKTPIPDVQIPLVPLAIKPLESQTLSGARKVCPPLAVPAPTAPNLTAELMPLPIAVLPLNGLSVPRPAREMLATVTPVIDALLPLAPLQVLALVGKNRSDLIRPATATAQTGTSSLTGEEVQALPASGRHWESFVLDTPGTVASGGGGAQASGEQRTVSLDGVEISLAFSGNSTGPVAADEDKSGQPRMAQPWAGGYEKAIGELAIHSVETVADHLGAESEQRQGGRIEIQTEHGSNALHGQGFYFDRQNTWGAQNPFTRWVKETQPPTAITTPTFTAEGYTPPDHEVTWGFGLGGRIRRNQLFWFAALDRNQRNDPGISTVKNPGEFFLQPSNDSMQVLSARLGLSSANPVEEGLAAYSKFLETLAGLLGPAARTASQDVGFARIDWQATERQRFTLEATGARWSSAGGGLTRVSEVYGNHSFGSSQASEACLMGRWESYLTPNLLAVAQATAGREILDAKPSSPSSFEKTLLSGNAWGQLPQIVADPRYGFTLGNPSRFGAGSYPDEHLYQAQGTLDWVRGNLLLKAGFEGAHANDATSLLRNQTGSYSYSDLGNFASDALSFAAFGLSGQLNRLQQHNCDQTGTVWRDSLGQLHGLGYLPCYAYYSQTLGPSDWYLSSNNVAGFVTTQIQSKKYFVLSAGLRWEHDLWPPPLAKLNNPELALTEQVPALGGQWGPRVSLALGQGESHWPVLRLGYGIYFGRTQNAVLETALTQTGSLQGDLNFFLRPTDNLNAGGAPPFPAVLNGDPGSVVKPGAIEFASNFREPEIHQAVVAVEERLPGKVTLTASAEVSLGRRLPISIDTNFDPAVNPGTLTYGVADGTGLGPLKTAQITVPFYASWPSATSPSGFAGRLNPDYQQIAQIQSRANSTYEAAMVSISRNERKGVSVHARYTYSHAMDWNPNESSQVSGSDLLDPAHFNLEYGTSDLDVRHSASAMLLWEAPWKLRGVAGSLGNGWMLSGIGQFHSGSPYTMRTAGSLSEEFNVKTGAAIVALAPGMNGSGGDNRLYGVGRNTYRYPATWKADLRLGKRFNLGKMRDLELLAESFNLFNHQNVTELETVGYSIRPGTTAGGLPTLNFLTGLKANTTAFGQPLNVNASDFLRERQVQIGIRIRF